MTSPQEDSDQSQPAPYSGQPQDEPFSVEDIEPETLREDLLAGLGAILSGGVHLAGLRYLKGELELLLEGIARRSGIDLLDRKLVSLPASPFKQLFMIVRRISLDVEHVLIELAELVPDDLYIRQQIIQIKDYLIKEMWEDAFSTVSIYGITATLVREFLEQSEEGECSPEEQEVLEELVRFLDDPDTHPWKEHLAQPLE